jgi:hypothetical protein
VLREMEEGSTGKLLQMELHGSLMFGPAERPQGCFDLARFGIVGVATSVWPLKQ